jgi:ketosteroid isomerase-like protein
MRRPPGTSCFAALTAFTGARLLVLALALGGASCSGETVERPPLGPVAWASLDVKPVVDAGADILTAKERELPEAYCAAIASQGFAALAPLLYEDADFFSPGLGTAHGREQVVRAHDLLLGAFDGRKMALGRVWRTPSEQTIEWTFTGVQARDWRGVPATGKPATFKGVTLLWTKDDGSIADIHTYFDVAVAKAQVGAGPKELRALAPPAPPAGPAQVFDQTQTGAADENTNVNLVKSALDALENHDEVAYVGAMADDVEVYTVERATPFRGKADAKSYYATMHKVIGQLDTTVANAWGVSDFAIVEYSIAGEQLGALQGIPAQRDKVIRFELVDICEIRDHHIVRIWRYDNPSQILD